jgi:hypothetical protein
MATSSLHCQKFHQSIGFDCRNRRMIENFIAMKSHFLFEECEDRGNLYFPTKWPNTGVFLGVARSPINDFEGFRILKHGKMRVPEKGLHGSRPD